MGNYNLGALDDKDFEALACDVVGNLLGVRVERFKPGKDAGVDGRWFATTNREGVLQCKHWMRSGFSALLKAMTEKEKPKVNRLCPARYFLATSVELSRHNKRRLYTALQPHIKSESDILGSEDIEDFLAKHPDVEKRHYKLWLSSAAILSSVFNNAVTGRSDFDVVGLQAKIPLLVKTNAFAEAAQILATRNTVIITGAPGIGKTTLAQQLILEHLSLGYELVSMRDITDGEAVYTKDKRQIFYFDDFLGRNMLEALKLQHDSQIVGFIRRVYHDKLKRFVLTSRSSILNQGKHLSDLFALEKTDKNEYEVRIDGLSRLDKARILYSHIWHSSLPNAMLNELFTDKRYKVIADHPNYNPRLISFITDSDKIGTVAADDYWDYVTATLKNPQDLWHHFFGQISQDCRDLAYLVVLNGRPITEHQLRLAFRRVRSKGGSDVGKIEHDAMVALKICTGSLLNRNIDSRSDSVTYDLYNPSIADYVLRVVHDWGAFANFFEALRTVTSLRNLREMYAARFVSEESYERIVDALALTHSEQPPDDAFMVELCGMILASKSLITRHRAMVRQRMNGLRVSDYVGDDLVLLEVTIAALAEGLLDAPNQRIGEMCDRLMEWPLGSDQFPLLGKLVGYGRGSEASNLVVKAKQCIKDYWKECIGDYVVETELLRDIYDSSQFDEGRKELFHELSAELSTTGLTFAPDEVSKMCDAVSMDRIADRNIDRDSRSGEDFDRPPTKSPREVEDSVIDDIFERDLPPA